MNFFIGEEEAIVVSGEIIFSGEVDLIFFNVGDLRLILRLLEYINLLISLLRGLDC